MKLSQHLILQAGHMVAAANVQRGIGGKIAVDSSLLLANLRWRDMSVEALELSLAALNEVTPSFMREEFILMLEGLIALREIKPVMDKELPKCEVKKLLSCKCCHFQTNLELFDCPRCGERFT